MSGDVTMNFLREMYDIFCGAIAEDRAEAREKRGDTPRIAPWQIGVVVLALILGVAIGVKTLYTPPTPDMDMSRFHR